MTTKPQISEYLFSRNPSLAGFCGFLKSLGRSRGKKPLCAFYNDLYELVAKRLGTGEAVKEKLAALNLSGTDVDRVAKRLTVCASCAVLCETELKNWECPEEKEAREHLERVKHSVIRDEEGSVGELIDSLTAVLHWFDDLTPEETECLRIAECLTGAKSGPIAESNPQDPAGKMKPIRLTDRDKNVMFILCDCVKDVDQQFMKAFLDQIPKENLNGVTRTLKIGLRITDVLFTEAGAGRILTKKEHFTKSDGKRIQLHVEQLKSLDQALRLRLLEMQVMNRITDKSLMGKPAQTLSARYCSLIVKALDRVHDDDALKATAEAFEAFRVLSLIFRHLSPLQSFAAVSVVRPENDDFVNMALNALNGVGLTLAQRTESRPATAA